MAGRRTPRHAREASLAHDLVEHKYWGVDSGRVEATGVAPIRISAQIPLSNRIVPGKNERWAAGALYPDALRNLLIAFAKRQTGLLQHPEFGEIACKAERIDVDISGDRRSTAMVDASWVETLDDEVISNIVASPVTEIELAASDLDASDTDLRKLVPELPKYETTFDDFAPRHRRHRRSGLAALVPDGRQDQQHRLPRRAGQRERRSRS